jgi:hypothetical protein
MESRALLAGDYSSLSQIEGSARAAFDACGYAFF